jgi:phosphotriesterase-related protein
MRQTELTGKAQTVLGIIDADSLGVTLPHEHLLLDVSCYFIEPTEATEKRLAHQPITLENLYWVKRHLLGHLDDLLLLDEQVAIKEALLYKWAGGDTIVELTNIGIARDPLALAHIARATGLNVIMGSGYYVGLSHPPGLATKTEEEITEEIVRDIMVGVGDTAVRAGIIGEIGCSIPLEDNERKVLRASAAAQQRTGAALNIHPSFSEDLVLEIIKILGDAGANLSRTIISHCGHSAFNNNRTILRKIADAGCYIEFDIFGYPALPYPPSVSTMATEGHLLGVPSEVDSINEIKLLINEGYLNHILISQDICFKHCYVTYGGAGYAHILRDVVPWMRRAGISDEQIHTMMVENPKRVLPFAPVKE